MENQTTESSPSASTPCSAFIALMASIERIRDRARQYAEEDENEGEIEAAEKQRKVEGTLNEILRIGKVLGDNLKQNVRVSTRPAKALSRKSRRKALGALSLHALFVSSISFREAGPCERWFNTLLFGSAQPTYSSYRYWQYVRPFYWVILAAVLLGTFVSLALLLAMCGHPQ